MIKHIFSTIAGSSRELLRNWRALIILLLLYVAMLCAVYLFFATREATVAQLIETFAVGILTPLLFFAIQMMALRYSAPNQRLLSLLGGSLRDSWKLIVISLPLILLAVLIVYSLGGIEFKEVEQAVRAAPLPPRPPAPKSAPPLQWQALALTSLEYLLLCVAIPLAAMHLWIATARDGLKSALRGAGRSLGRAFAPGAVMTYAIGFAVFAVIPYFIVFSKTTGASTWTDIGFLGVRLAVAVIVSLTGWVITLGALSPLAAEAALSADESAAEPAGPEGKQAPLLP